MPKSRRRKPRSSAPRSSHAKWDSTRAELSDWLPLLQATDEAESRGDAVRALGVIASRPLDRNGEVFWRPERTRRLSQLAHWGPLLPRWATSRWVLAQAAQQLSPGARSARQSALTLAVARRGAPDRVLASQSRWLEMDIHTQVVDHDWAYRQLLLYDFGGLGHFLLHGATPTLLARADDMAAWARAPMGGYLLLAQDAATVHWLDLGTGETVSVPNIGSALLLLPGEHAIGRLVPIEDGVLFESIPLPVPEQVAREVAAAPSDWSEIIGDHSSADVPEERRVMTGGHDFDLLSDASTHLQLLAAWSLTGAGTDPVRARAELVMRAVDGFVPDGPQALPVAPVVSAILTDPVVHAELGRRLSPTDKSRLASYADQLPAPCAALCRLLVEGQEMAS